MDVAAITQLLQSSYDDLSPQLRQAARYILAHPEEVALTSMRRMATHAGVKPSTMVRLARAVGFDGFEDLRDPYRRWLRGGEGAFEARARSLRERGAGGAEELLQEIADADAANLAGTDAPAVRMAVLDAAEALLAARRVFVLGLRSCFSLAHYFHYTCSMVGVETRLIDGHGGTSLDALRGIGDGDVLLAFSFRPYSQDTVRAVEAAAEAGARVIAVTDAAVSPVAHPARHVVVVETASPNFFQSLVGPLAVTEQLLGAVVCRIGEDGLTALKDHERHLTRFDAYWREPKRRRRT